jgi:hypothetical protein
VGAEASAVRGCEPSLSVVAREVNADCWAGLVAINLIAIVGNKEIIIILKRVLESKQ